jgi:hypothetical protein
MGVIVDLSEYAFRDFVVPNLPVSGEHEPDKADIRAIFPAIESALADIGLMGAIAYAYPTVDEMNAAAADSPAPQVNDLALVYLDPVAANNGVWVLTGSSPAWEQTAFISPAAILEAIDAAAAAAILSMTEAQEDLSAQIAADGAAALTALEYTTKTVPASETDVVIDDLDRTVEATIKANGERQISSLRVWKTVNGVTAARFNAAVDTMVRNLRYRGSVSFPFDVNIVLVSGQSNSESADSVPMYLRTGRKGVIMLDTPRPRHWVGAWSNDFTLCLGVENLETTNHWGGDMFPAIGMEAMDLIELENRSAFKQHRKFIMPVSIGRSGSDVSAFSYGTDTFDAVLSHLRKVKEICDAKGLRVGIAAGAWAWGANAYDNNIGQASTYTKVHDYWFNDVDSYIAGDIFGQPEDDFPVGIVQSGAHGPRNNGTNNALLTPFVALAELQLAADFDRFDIIGPEGPLFYNRHERGLGGSGVHHSSREDALMGAHIGRWFVRRALHKEAWPTFLPTLTKTGARQLVLTVPNIPGGFRLGLRSTGLVPGIMQPYYGTWTCDPATPGTEIAPTGDVIIGTNTVTFNYAADLPATPEMRNGSRNSSNIHHGNLAVVTDLAELDDTFTTNGTAWALDRYLPVFKLQAA